MRYAIPLALVVLLTAFTSCHRAAPIGEAYMVVYRGSYLSAQSDGVGFVIVNALDSESAIAKALGTFPGYRYRMAFNVSGLYDGSSGLQAASW